MHTPRFVRGLLISLVLLSLLSGMVGPRLMPAYAASQMQVSTDTETATPTATDTATPTSTNTPTNTPIPPHVVISEVAWGGTKASIFDQWIELYNPTTSDVDLTGWQITTGDGFPQISLAGTILAGDYYLIERGDDRVVKDVTADLVVTFEPLSDIGESLFLLDPARNRVDTANNSGGAWPAGGKSGDHPSMERAMLGGLIVPDGPFAWVTNTGVVMNGIDAADNPIYGTPKNPNWAFIVTLTPTATNTSTSTPTLTPTRTPTRTITPTGTLPTATPTIVPPQTIIINEVAWMGTASSRLDEWIELWNPSASPVSLDGWRIRSTDGVVNILLSGTIEGTPAGTPAGSRNVGFFLIANPGTFEDLTVDQTISFSLIDDGKSLQLLDSTGVVIDTVNPNGGGWPAGVKCTNSTSTTPIPTPIANTCASMERDLSKGFGDAHWYTFADKEGGTVRDRYGLIIRGTPGYDNWAVSVTATPTKAPVTSTPTRRPGSVVPTPTATVVINEFLPRAGFDWNQDGKVDVFDEFIEIANLGPVDVNLAGWKLDDAAGQGSNPYTLPAKTLKPGERIVFYASQTNVLLSDGGDTVRLLNPNNVIKDARSYSIVKVPDVSWCRLPDINGSWYADCFPTPNQRNSRTGEVPAAPPGTGLEEPFCLLPDTLPEPFRQAECNGFGADMWQSMYWDVLGWFKDFIVPQNDSKWETFVE